MKNNMKIKSVKNNAALNLEEISQTHSPTATLMKLLMFLSLSLSKLTSSTASPALPGLNWMLALASCLGPTSPILQDTGPTLPKRTSGAGGRAG